jgi:peptide deformylase
MCYANVMDISLDGLLHRVRVMGDPVLKVRCKEVEVFGAQSERVAQQLENGLVLEQNGIGLAANQIGLSVRAFSYDLRDSSNPSDFHGVIFNPVVVDSDGGSYFNEGCLSIPGLRWDIFRPETIFVEGQDLHGNSLQFELDGLASRLFQHEIDHLDGLLILDRISDPDEKKEAILQATQLIT